jgi:hypothetical protein
VYDTSQCSCPQNWDDFIDFTGLVTAQAAICKMSATSADLKVVLLGHKNVGPCRTRGARRTRTHASHHLPPPTRPRARCSGKTSVFNRYVYDDFIKTSMVRARVAPRAAATAPRRRVRAQTIGAYFAMKQCRIKDRPYNLAIWVRVGRGGARRTRAALARAPPPGY